MLSHRLLTKLFVVGGRQNGRHFATSEKKKVFISTKIPDAAVEMLTKANVHIEHYWNSEDPIPRDKFLHCAKDVDGIYCVLTDKIDKQLLDVAKKLKTVSTMSVGFDHVDVEECKKLNVSIGNTPGVLTETTADLVIALLFATARRIPEGVDAVRNNGWSQNWRPLWLCGKDVHSSTIGIVGMGRIGQAVARRLNGFGCKILYTGPRPKPELADPVGAKYVDMDTLLAQSDFVIPLCPLNASTRQLFNAEKFKKMKQGSIFINASRGPVVDQTALIDALRHGPLFAAGLDVTDPEPLPSGHTLLAEDLKSKLVILPHIGSASYATRENMSFIAADNLVRGLNGEKLKHAVWEATK